MASDLLQRFEITVLKNKSGSDTAQVPAQATVSLYMRGATVSSDVGIPSTEVETIVHVHDVGRVTAEGLLSAGVGGPTLLVISVDLDAKTITVANNEPPNGFTLHAGTRLIILGPRPHFFSDPEGIHSLGTSVTSSNTDGRANAYVGETGFDYTVSGTGITTRLYVDAGVDPHLTVYDARSFASMQDAVDACPAGGRLLIPRGFYDLPAGGLRITKPIEVFGDGQGTTTEGTILRPHQAGGAVDHALVITSNDTGDSARNVYVHDLMILGYAVGEGDGIHATPSPGGVNTSGIIVERVTVQCMHHGLCFEPSGNGGSNSLVVVRDCTSNSNTATGLTMRSCPGGQVLGGWYDANGSYGLDVEGIKTVSSVYIEDNQRGATDPSKAYSYDAYAQLRIAEGDGVVLEGLVFEDFVQRDDVPDAPVNPPAVLTYQRIAVLVDHCFGIHVSGCSFVNNRPPKTPGNSIGFRIQGGSRGNTFGSNSYKNVNIPLEILGPGVVAPGPDPGDRDPGLGNNGNIIGSQAILACTYPYGNDDVSIPDDAVDFPPGSPGEALNCSGGNLTVVAPPIYADREVPEAQPVVGIKVPRVADRVLSYVQARVPEGALAYSSDRRTVRANVGEVDVTGPYDDFHTRTALVWKTLASGAPSINASDYPCLQDAVNALPEEGGTVYLPAGTYPLERTLQLVKRVHLVGEGIDRTKIRWADPEVPGSDYKDKTMVWVQNSFCVLEGLHIVGPGVPGGGYGVLVGDTTLGYDSTLYGVRLIECAVQHTASYALYVDAYWKPRDPVDIVTYDNHFERCLFIDCHSEGSVYIEATSSTQTFLKCEFGMAGDYDGEGALVGRLEGYQVNQQGGSNISYTDCVFQGAKSTRPWAAIKDAVSCRLVGCWFEDEFLPPPPELSRYFVELHGFCAGIEISNCNFRRNKWDCTKAIKADQDNDEVGHNCQGVFLSNNEFYTPTFNVDSPHGDVRVENAGSRVMHEAGWHASDHEYGMPIVQDASKEQRTAGEAFGWLNAQDFHRVIEVWDEVHQMFVNVFPNPIQAAIDALPAGGGTVVIPPGRWEFRSKPDPRDPNKKDTIIIEGATIDGPGGRHVRLVGAGCGKTTISFREAQDSSIDMLHIGIGVDVTIENIALEGYHHSGTGRGIVIGGGGASRVALRNCRITHTPSWALHVGENADLVASYDNVEFGPTYSDSHGCVYMGEANVRAHVFTACKFGGTNDSGASPGECVTLVRAEGILFQGCKFEGAYSGAYLGIYGCRAITVRASRFEHQLHDGDYFIRIDKSQAYGILARTVGVTVDNCLFVRDKSVNPKLVQYLESSCGLVLLNPTAITVQDPEHTNEERYATDVNLNGSLEGAVLIGGTVEARSADGASVDFGDLHVNDNATGRTGALWGTRRVRIPRLATAEVTAMAERQPGDMVFDHETNQLKVVVMDGPNRVWRVVQTAP